MYIFSELCCMNLKDLKYEVSDILSISAFLKPFLLQTIIPSVPSLLILQFMILSSKLWHNLTIIIWHLKNSFRICAFRSNLVDQNFCIKHDDNCFFIFGKAGFPQNLLRREIIFANKVFFFQVFEKLFKRTRIIDQNFRVIPSTSNKYVSYLRKLKVSIIVF